MKSVSVLLSSDDLAELARVAREYLEAFEPYAAAVASMAPGKMNATPASAGLKDALGKLVGQAGLIYGRFAKAGVRLEACEPEVSQ